jgi:hypothetical protein
MKTILTLLFALATTAVGSEQFSMFFRFGSGTRIDLSPDSAEGKSSSDAFPDSAVLHIMIPKDRSDAQISLTYGKDAKEREDQSYSGTVIHHTKDMISIVCNFEGADKIENIVIYPSKGSAFLMVQSAYLGSDLMKLMSPTKPEIPYGSVSTFRLHQLQK